MALGCSIVWATIITVTGFDFSLIAIMAGLFVGTGVRAGAGRPGLLPALIAAVMTYLTVTGTVAMAVFYEFAMEGDLVLAIIGVPFSILGYIPFLMIEMDVMALFFFGLAMFTAIRVALVDAEPDYQQY